MVFIKLKERYDKYPNGANFEIFKFNSERFYSNMILKNIKNEN